MATIDKMPMLAEGYERLQREVRHLKMIERPSIVEAIEEARAHGDLSENAEYHAAKERQGQVGAQVADVERPPCWCPGMLNFSPPGSARAMSRPRSRTSRTG